MEKVVAKKEKAPEKEEDTSSEKNCTFTDAFKEKLGYMSETFEQVGNEVLSHIAEQVGLAVHDQLTKAEGYLFKKLKELHGKKGEEDAKKYIGKWKAVLLSEIQKAIMPEIRKELKSASEVEAVTKDDLALQFVAIAALLKEVDKKQAKELLTVASSITNADITGDDEDDLFDEEDGLQERMGEDENDGDFGDSEEIEIDARKIAELRAFANRLAAADGNHVAEAEKIIAALSKRDQNKNQETK